MGTGWRRALCTKTPPTDSDDSPATTTTTRRTNIDHRPKTKTTKLPFFSSSPSFLSTPRLHCRTRTTPTTSLNVNACLVSSTPSSPRSHSPLKLSLFRNSFRLRNTCGVCTQSVKTGQGMAIYTAECGHCFHFPCIASHVRHHSNLVCPVCNITWKDIPLLAIHKNLPPDTAPFPHQTLLLHHHNNNDMQNIKKKTGYPDSSPRRQYYHHHHHEPLVQFYDDDEPLVSPRAAGGGKFSPTLPAKAVVNDDEQEFQGFFVNPVSSCSTNAIDSRKIEVTLMPEAAVVSSTTAFQTFALAMRVKAPPSLPAAQRINGTAAPLLDPTRRAPIDLVTVLDVGKTMTGAKLQMLKRAMRLVISSLGPADRLSIISFSASPKRLLPLRRMTAQGQRSARHIVDRLVISHGSHVAEALSGATKVLEDRRERNPVASIILLSDAHDQLLQPTNANTAQQQTHVSPTTRFAHVEIPVNSFGDSKRGGSGSPEPAEDAFAKCVGEFLSVVAQDLRIQLGFGTGSAPAENTAVYCCNGRPTVLSSGVIKLGDLYAEEVIELLVELKVPTTAVGSSHHVMTVRCSYNDPATQEIFFDREQTLILPVPSPEGRGQSPSPPKIERLRNVFIATRAIAECRNLVERSAFSSAHHLLSSAKALLLMQSSSTSAEEHVKSLEAEIVELACRRQQQQQQHKTIQMGRTCSSGKEMETVDEDGEQLTPTSAWRAAEQLAKVAIAKKSFNRVRDLHGFEDARF